MIAHSFHVHVSRSGQTGSDGFWYLIVRSSNGKDVQGAKAQYQKLIQIINANQGKIRDAASKGDFKLLIKLLTQDSHKQGGQGGLEEGL